MFIFLVSCSIACKQACDADTLCSSLGRAPWLQGRGARQAEGPNDRTSEHRPRLLIMLNCIHLLHVMMEKSSLLGMEHLAKLGSDRQSKRLLITDLAHAMLI